MVSIEELKQKFVNEKNPIHKDWLKGESIVILGTDFNPDWESELAEQGYRIHNTSLNGKAVTLVYLKKAVPNGKSVYVPPKASVIEVTEKTDPLDEPKAEKKSNSWTAWAPEEDKLLIELRTRQPRLNGEEVFAEFHKAFPNRPRMGTDKHISKLQKKGLITKNRRVPNKAALSEPPTEEPPQEPEPAGLIEVKPDLETKQQIDKLHKELEELKTELKKLNDFVLTWVYVPLNENTEAIKELKPALAKHKHLEKTGEAVLTMEP